MHAMVLQIVYCIKIKFVEVIDLFQFSNKNNLHELYNFQLYLITSYYGLKTVQKIERVKNKQQTNLYFLFKCNYYSFNIVLNMSMHSSNHLQKHIQFFYRHT